MNAPSTPTPRREAVAPSPAALADRLEQSLEGYRSPSSHERAMVYVGEIMRWIDGNADTILAALRSAAGPAGGPSRPAPSLAATMIGNMLFNLRQPQSHFERDEVIRCLEHVESAAKQELAAAEARAREAEEALKARTGDVVPPGYELVPVAALNWLHGIGPDDNGHHFGDGPEANRHGRPFWWRSVFRRMCGLGARARSGGQHA